MVLSFYPLHLLYLELENIKTNDHFKFNMDLSNSESLTESVFAELGFFEVNRNEDQYSLSSSPLAFDNMQQGNTPISVIIEEGITETSGMIPNYTIANNSSNLHPYSTNETYSNTFMELQPSSQSPFSFPNASVYQQCANEYLPTINSSTSGNDKGVSFTFSGGQIYQNLTTATSKIHFNMRISI